MLVLLAATTLPALSRAMPKANPLALAIGAVVGLTFGLIVLALITFIQLVLCHLIAKWFFGATGKFVELMRPLLMGWFVNCLALRRQC
jgi:hypothetical protein